MQCTQRTGHIFCPPPLFHPPTSKHPTTLPFHDRQLPHPPPHPPHANSAQAAASPFRLSSESMWPCPRKAPLTSDPRPQGMNGQTCTKKQTIGESPRPTMQPVEGVGVFGALVSPGDAATPPHQKNVPPARNEMYQRGRKFEADFFL